MASLAAPKRLAKVVAPTSAGVEECGRVLASGGLCAFPTETVYGLGANALDEAAVRRIFEVKRRPLSDPLIVHVAEPEDAFGLVDLGGARAAAHKVFVTLTRAFWPGPLTLRGRRRGAPPPRFEAPLGRDVPKAKNVFIADLQAEKASPGLIAGVADRVYRATSGNTIEIPRAPKAEGPQ
ncbi:L-threonylcarbamoyladenylate synthase [Aureococcus anophagefferens]|nr:L-threonylcarbamoyladenylate synthase [Aureococcus anophagefferens]